MIDLNIAPKQVIYSAGKFITIAEATAGMATILTATSKIFIPISLTVNSLNSGYSLSSADMFNGTTADSYTGTHNITNGTCKTIPCKDVLNAPGDILFQFTPITGADTGIYLYIIYALL